MDFVAAVVADEESFELVEPCEGAFDDPAVASEARAVRGLAPRDLRGDTAAAKLTTAVVVVVAAISADTVGPASRPTDLAANRWDAIDERDQLCAVVPVAACDRPRERQPGRVYEKVMLGTVSGSINRARARLGAPFFACT